MEQEQEVFRAWYVVQTYSGLEAAAKRNIEQRIISLNMQDYIFQVLIPEKTRQEKNKKGEFVDVVEKIYPGYLFIDMIVTDDSWFIVRNTPMVTGFLGSSGGGAKPVPLPDEEIIPILKECGIKLGVQIQFKVGDTVRVLSGLYAGQEVVVDSIDFDNEEVTILVEMFSTLTPQILSFNEVEAIK